MVYGYKYKLMGVYGSYEPTYNSGASPCTLPFQEPKSEVPTIYKAYFLGG